MRQQELTEEQIIQLEELYLDLTIFELSALLEVTEYRVKAELRARGLTKNGRWTQSEDEILKRYYPDYGTRLAQAEFYRFRGDRNTERRIARTPSAISARAANLGLSFNPKQTPHPYPILPLPSETSIREAEERLGLYGI